MLVFSWDVATGPHEIADGHAVAALARTRVAYEASRHAEI